MIRRVLLGIGGTPFSHVAIRRAVEIAEMQQAHVTAVTVVDEKRLGAVGAVPLGGGTAAADLREYRLGVTREQIEETLDEFKRVSGQRGVPITILREQGVPFQLMIDHARYHDLALFGLRSMFEYRVLGDSDVEPAKVLRDLIEGGVRPLIAVDDDYRPIRRVLVAYSGSVQSAESLKEWIRLRLSPEAALRLLVCEHPQGQAEHLLTEASIYCRAHGMEPERQYRPEDAKRGILAEAEEWDADLLVLGSSARSWLSATFFETTMLHVVRHVGRPIFVGT
jgi:nucleotide-binding universal stress UspA family protein